MRRHPGAVAVAAAAVVLQCVALYAPSLPAAPGTGIPGLDKVGHAAMFAVTTWALARVVGVRIAVVLMVVQSGASEWIQGAVLPARTAEVLDAFADAVGITLGVLWFRVATRRVGGTPRETAAGRGQRTVGEGTHRSVMDEPMETDGNAGPESRRGS